MHVTREFGIVDLWMVHQIWNTLCKYIFWLFTIARLWAAIQRCIKIKYAWTSSQQCLEINNGIFYFLHASHSEIQLNYWKAIKRALLHLFCFLFFPILPHHRLVSVEHMAQHKACKILLYCIRHTCRVSRQQLFDIINW